MGVSATQLRNCLLLLVLAHRAGKGHASLCLFGCLFCDFALAEPVIFYIQFYITAGTAKCPVLLVIVLNFCRCSDTVLPLSTVMAHPLQALRTYAVRTSALLCIIRTAVLAPSAVGTNRCTVFAVFTFRTDLCTVGTICTAVPTEQFCAVSAVMTFRTHTVCTLTATTAVRAELVNTAGTSSAILADLIGAVSADHTAVFADFRAVSALHTLLTPHILTGTFPAEVT